MLSFMHNISSEKAINTLYVICNPRKINGVLDYIKFKNVP